MKALAWSALALAGALLVVLQWPPATFVSCDQYRYVGSDPHAGETASFGCARFTDDPTWEQVAAVSFIAFTSAIASVAAASSGGATTSKRARFMPAVVTSGLLVAASVRFWLLIPHLAATRGAETVPTGVLATACAIAAMVPFADAWLQAGRGMAAKQVHA